MVLQKCNVHVVCLQATGFGVFCDFHRLTCATVGRHLRLETELPFPSFLWLAHSMVQFKKVPNFHVCGRVLCFGIQSFGYASRLICNAVSRMWSRVSGLTRAKQVRKGSRKTEYLFLCEMVDRTGLRDWGSRVWRCRRNTLRG